MAIKLAEYTGGAHIYMKVMLDSKRIEEIDVYFRADGEHIVTSADDAPANHPAGLRAGLPHLTMAGWRPAETPGHTARCRGKPKDKRKRGKS